MDKTDVVFGTFNFFIVYYNVYLVSAHYFCLS